MLYRAYCIFDKLAEESSPVFTAKNDSVAFRNYKVALRDVPSESEFVLYYVGDFDNVKCLLFPAKEPQTISLERPVLEAARPGKE